MNRFYRSSTIVAATTALLTLTACGSTAPAPEPYYTSPEEVTVERIIEKSTPSTILEEVGGFSVTYDYDKTGQAATDDALVCTTFRKDGDLIEITQNADYEDGSYSHLYANSDAQDPYIYLDSSAGTQSAAFTEENMNALLSETLREYEFYETTLLSTEEQEGVYIVTLGTVADSMAVATDTLTIDPATGYILHASSIYEMGATCEMDCVYDAKIAIDSTPKEKAGTPAETAPPVSTHDPASNNKDSASTDISSKKLDFNTTDIDGNPVSLADFKDASLIMVNFWEPWCGPCVGEMPDLAELYEAYKGEGLVILGVFSTEGQDDDARAILEDCKVTYPILRCDANLAQFTTDYVPTTFFADAEGNVLSAEPVVGAQSKDDWERLITAYLSR